MTKDNSQKRAFSLLKTIGSTAVKAGREALESKFKLGDEISLAALRLTKGLDELKGAAMKIGQMMSMMDDQMLPKGWKEALSKLQAEATPRDWSEIEPLILKELGNLDAFSEINKTALHAASIAQVHSATLKNGTKVALKVQYPNLEKNIKSDLESMRKLIKLANIMPNMANYDHLFNAAEDMFKQELDFNREMKFYKIYVEQFKDNPNIVVPKPIEELCTSTLLTTQWVDGCNLQKWMEENSQIENENCVDNQKQEARNKIGKLMLEVIFKEIINLQHIQSDPNPGNFLVTPDNKLVLLDFGATQILSSDVVDNYKNLCKAGLNKNRGDVFRYAKKLGFLETGDSDEIRNSFLKIFQLALEPFSEEMYNWLNCSLSKRLNSESFVFMKLTKFRAPSGEILFMNRRLAGNLMMLEKLGSNFPAQKIFHDIINDTTSISGN